MKNQILSIVLLIVGAGLTAHGQEYNKFRVGMGGGYAAPGGSGSKGGVLFYLEPGYRLSDQVLVNLRMEWAVIAPGLDADVSTNESFKTSTMASYTLNGQYYLGANKLRPFVGAGVGLFMIQSLADFSGSNTLAPSSTKFGFYPRVGLDVGHFTLSLDYNVVSKTTVSTQSTTQITNASFKNSYFGIRLGGFFGGGKSK